MGNSFDERAAVWDENPQRLVLVENIWNLIKEQINFQTINKVLDYGCGTGLLGYKTIKLVDFITLCDTSTGMLEQAQKKKDFYGYQNVEIVQADFTTDALPKHKYDLILSMMVLHHVSDITLLLNKFNELLNLEGQFCWIDLDIEDGSFHDDNSGIPHFGFSKPEIEDYFHTAGFALSYYSTELFMPRERTNGTRNYPLFIALASK